MVWLGKEMERLRHMLTAVHVQVRWTHRTNIGEAEKQHLISTHLLYQSTECSQQTFVCEIVSIVHMYYFCDTEMQVHPKVTVMVVSLGTMKQLKPSQCPSSRTMCYREIGTAAHPEVVNDDNL